MVVAQLAYEGKLDQILTKLKGAKEENEGIRTRGIPSFLIKRFPPIEGKIRLKMKTTKQFKPMLDIENLSSENVKEVIEKMSKSLEQLLDWVEQTRKKRCACNSL